MFRRAIVAGALALGMAPVAYAQQPTTPPVPEDVLAPRELIAWTSLQTPRPVPQQIPAIQAQPHQSDHDSAQRQQLTIDSKGEQTSSQSNATAQPSARNSRSRTNPIGEK